MSVIVYFLFFLFLIFIVFFFSVGLSILKLFRKTKKYNRHQDAGSGQRNNTSKDSDEYGQNKKIFSKDEGEYVDFEEIE